MPLIRCRKEHGLAKPLDLGPLFNPSSIAVVGASDTSSKAGGRFVKGLLDGGYRGTVYPVNPGLSASYGIKCYSNVLDLPDGLDLAIVAVPAKAVPAVVGECSIKHVRFIIVHSAGFAELGAEGKALEQEMVRLLGAGGTRLIGPNCMGLFVPRSRINMIVYGAAIGEPGGVSFVGQSGWVTENVVVLGSERGLRFSKIMSIGNQSDLTVEDVLEYLVQDDETRVIAMYVEGIKNGRRFFDIVKEAARKKPVIIWKSGRSAIGARAASSHTASLAGNAVVFDALSEQTGLVQTHDLDDLMDMMVGFSCPVYPKGKRVAVLCESGGGAVSSSDAAEDGGLEIPTLTLEGQMKVTQALMGRVPPFAPPRNPVDLVWGPADDPAGLFVACGRVMLKETDAAVMLNYQRFDEGLVQKMAGLRDEMAKPIFVAPGYVTHNRPGMAVLTGNGIPCFNSPGRAIRVLSQVVKFEVSQHRSDCVCSVLPAPAS
jgi:acyl-CoA synthetase (NDP forming)